MKPFASTHEELVFWLAVKTYCDTAHYCLDVHGQDMLCPACSIQAGLWKRALRNIMRLEGRFRHDA